MGMYSILDQGFSLHNSTLLHRTLSYNSLDKCILEVLLQNLIVAYLTVTILSSEAYLQGLKSHFL